MTRTLVVVGHGMVGHWLVERIRDRDREGRWRIVVLAEEPRRPPTTRWSWPPAPGPSSRRSRDATCGTASGSHRGHDLPYRTVEDIEAIGGGGLLGLEAANALRLLGMRSHVVETAPHLLPLQIDAGAGQVLADLIGKLGVQPHCGTITRSVDPGPDGRVCAVTLDDRTRLEAALVVFATGVRPRDDLAEPSGLTRGPRGGILVDDHCRTADPRIWAIGECAAVEGRCYGLVAPGYRMAESVAAQLLGLPARPFAEADTSTRLKLLGVDVASFGDCHAETPGALEYIRHHHRAGSYAKLVLADDARTLLGGVLAGDTSAYPLLHSLMGREMPAGPEQLLLGTPHHGPHHEREPAWT
ncbi:NAD(P)/FAD-dependent oxidoreductase [Streptomyces sp. Rer75]|uniref:NAD(P)/FAD-dependent oxidoreductase n=1 Tax=Streptomyces sp. Rer75 TaxID=2750011 RepID=UPI00211EB7C4|nr:FAD-dependent oxidoreductase [Streptomyces sp. Rer75]